MMASDHDDHAERTDDGRRISRYDLVLAVIPAAFLLAGVASQFLAVPTHHVVAAATSVGVLALVDSLFVNPPQSGSGTL